MKTSTTVPSGTQLTAQNLEKAVAQAYNSPQFSALISIDGVDRNTGRPFHHDFIFDQTDPEFVSMLNDYGARKTAETADTKPAPSPCKDIQKSLELILLVMLKSCENDQEVAFVKASFHYITAKKALDRHKSLTKK